MAFCAVELARARGANVLIICKALWRETRYIVERYNENLSAGNLSCLRRLLNRSREHNRIHTQVPRTPARPINTDNPSRLDLRQRLRKERSQ